MGAAPSWRSEREVRRRGRADRLGDNGVGLGKSAATIVVAFECSVVAVMLSSPGRGYTGRSRSSVSSSSILKEFLADCFPVGKKALPGCWFRVSFSDVWVASGWRASVREQLPQMIVSQELGTQ